MGKYLAVPVRLDALRVKQETAVIGQMADFSLLPWVNTGDPAGPREMNPDLAYIGENIIAQPFSDLDLWLEPGIHLHWALPEALTIGKHPKDENGNTDYSSPLSFPFVPNRWFVRRTYGGDIKTWVVESDFISTTDSEGVSYPLTNPAAGGQPFGHLGRQVQVSSVDKWTEQSGKLQENYLAGADKLTALGYGEHTFAALYPNCYTVFGLYDDLSGISSPAGTITYEVIGWYSNQKDDPVYQLGQKADSPASSSPSKQFLDELSDDFEWKVSDADDSLDPKEVAGMLCQATLNLNFDANPAPIDPSVAVAVGNTGTEALSAYLASKLATGQGNENLNEQFEDQLEALTLTSVLQAQQLDLGYKFEEGRHTKSYTATAGGTLWELRKQQNSSGKQTPQPAGAQVTPAADLADDIEQFASSALLLLSDRLDQLNWWQAAYDRGTAALTSMQRQIFSEWYKYMLCCYRPADAARDYPDIDAVKQLIETDIAWLNLKQAFVGQAQITSPGVADGLTSALQNYRSYLAAAAQPCPDNLPALLWADVLPAGSQWLGPDDDTADAGKQVYSIGYSLMGAYKTLNSLVGAVNDVLTAANAAAAVPVDTPDTIGFLNQFGQRLFALIEVVSPLTSKTQSSPPGEEGPPAQSPADALINAANSIKKSVSLASPSHPLDTGTYARLLTVALPAYTLQRVPAPRYWRPNEPVVLLVGESVKATDNSGEDGALTCCITDADVGAIDHPAQAFPANTFPASETDGNPWNPLLLEWEVEVRPVSGDQNPQGNVPAETRQYDPDFISNNYVLGEDRAEFIRKKDTAASIPSTSIFTGRCVINPGASDVLKQQIENYIVAQTSLYISAHNITLSPGTDVQTQVLNYFNDDRYQESILQWCDAQSPTGDAPIRVVKKAYDELRKIGRVQAQALGGFNEALLMHQQTVQLPVADPLAFADYMSFTNLKVNGAVGNQNHFAPEPLFDFNPIRTGGMKITRLRLIDSFGRVQELTSCENPIVSQQMLPDAQQGENDGDIELPARVVQPARVNFRWLSALGDTAEANSLPLTSPICGWVMPNNLDNSLMIYDAQGGMLGYIDEEGRWRSSPGREGPVRPTDIINPHLRRMVKWICDTAAGASNQTTDGVTPLNGNSPGEVDATPGRGDAPNPFIADFLGTLNAALEQIDPENFAQYEARALLMGRPVALVRAMVNLELQGPPARHQGWVALRRRLLGQQAKIDDFTYVKFPVRVGETAQLNDGIVGYWVENAYGYEGGVFYAPQSQDSQTGADQNINIYDTGDDFNLYQSFDDPPIYLSLLMDPRGLAHCTTGVLPTKALSIPPEQFAGALKRINVTFLSAPLLTPQGRVNVPLPAEPGFIWSWLQKDGTKWDELTTTPVVELQPFVDAFANQSPNGYLVWQQLCEKAYIVPIDSTRAKVNTPGKSQQPLDADFTGMTDDIMRVLDLATRMLGPVTTDADFAPGVEIREGWLQLSPVD